jgi:hypothetical protein
MACCNYGDATMTVTLNYEPCCSDAFPCLNGKCCVPKEFLDRLGNESAKRLYLLHKFQNDLHERDKELIELRKQLFACQSGPIACLGGRKITLTAEAVETVLETKEREINELRKKLANAQSLRKAESIDLWTGKPWSELYRECCRKNLRLIEDKEQLQDRLASCGRAFETFAQSAREMKSVAMFSSIATSARLDSLIECLDCAAVAVERA